MFTHGPVQCDTCWTTTTSNTSQERGGFRLVRDPGYWGAGQPEVLVLGMSKGNTQANAYGRQSFEQVAFKGIRSRLLQLLQAVELIPCEETAAQFERRFCQGEREFGFASVVRCSLSAWSEAKQHYTAEGPLVLRAFNDRSDGYAFVKACINQHLVRLPPRTQLVVLLGNSDAYIAAMRSALGVERGAVSALNPVAYSSRNVLFVHIAHPSRGNGHFGNFIRGEGTSGQKLEWARAALRSRLVET